MTTFEESFQHGHEGIKLPDHNQPSDYSDVMPSDYDPDYISQISSKMQVPHRIGVGSEGGSGGGNFHVNGNTGPQPQYSHAGMHVPDKIIIAVNSHEHISPPGAAQEIQRLDEEHSCKFPDMSVPYNIIIGHGDNQHIGGMRQELYMDTPTPQMSTESLSYVGLMTPPRTLTLEERFPIVEDVDVTHNHMSENPRHNSAPAPPLHPRQISGPVAYEPGVDPRDPLLLNDENEATLLRTQVAKLTRRVQVIEQDNSRRATRDLVVYPLILGYFLWKLLGWAARDHRF